MDVNDNDFEAEFRIVAESLRKNGASEEAIANVLARLRRAGAGGLIDKDLNELNATLSRLLRSRPRVVNG